MRTTSETGSLQAPISMRVIRRIPEYLNVVRRLREEGLEWVSSEELAQACGLNPSSVRTDLGCFGKFGLARHGYNVEKLNQALEGILGVDRELNVVIVGAGHMGQAIANHENFRKRGFYVKAILDNAPAVIGQRVAGVTVKPMSALADLVANEGIEIGAICVPASEAQSVAEQLVNAGVTGLWNFAPVQLTLPHGVAVEDVHLTASLMTLGYQVKQRHAQAALAKGTRRTRQDAERPHYAAQRVRP